MNEKSKQGILYDPHKNRWCVYSPDSVADASGKLIPDYEAETFFETVIYGQEAEGWR